MVIAVPVNIASLSVVWEIGQAIDVIAEGAELVAGYISQPATAYYER